MISERKIARINELSKKKKQTGLSATEKKEQEQLRQEYLGAVKTSLKGQLNSIKVVDENGNVLKDSNRK